MTHRGGIFISLGGNTVYNAAREEKQPQFGLPRAETSTSNISSHRNLRLHRHCDKGLHQGVQRCIQAEKVEHKRLFIGQKHVKGALSMIYSACENEILL